MAIGLKTGAQLLEVEDLAIEDDGVSASLVGEGLMAGLRCIDDAQPAMAQYRACVPVYPFIVRAPVGDATQGFMDPVVPFGTRVKKTV
jgi:hypothetical protein